jgi:uncharacterized membrane protein YcaP (DUF421 family)
MNDLIEELRMQGYYNLADVEYAILETSGQLSIIPKTESAPVTRSDLKIKSTQDTLPITLVLDGKINSKNLIKAEKTEDWLYNMLKKNSIHSTKDILIAILDTKGKFYYQLKEKSN